MRKRIITMLAAVFAMVMMLVVQVSADDWQGHQYLVIGGHEITNLDKDAKGTGWSYEAKTCTITLNNYNGGKIEFWGQYGRGFNATFVLKGKNVIKNGSIWAAALGGSADWTFEGDGSLTITNDEEYGNDFLSGADSLTVNSGKIELVTANYYTEFGMEKVRLNGGTLLLKRTYVGEMGYRYGNEAMTASGQELNGGTLIVENQPTEYDESVSALKCYDKDNLKGDWRAYDKAGKPVELELYNLHYVRVESEPHVLGCNPGPWKVVAAATETKTGKEARLCTICGKETASRSIPKLPAVEKTLKKGATFRDAKTNAYYIVTREGKEVAYQKPASKTLKTVTIPASVKYGKATFTVTAVSSKAFYKNTAVQKITVGKYVKSIGSYAFASCKNLVNVHIISKVLTAIGSRAFYGDSKLSILTIYSEKLTASRVGKEALKGIKTTAQVRVPSRKLNSYKAVFKGKGQSSRVKLVKI